jgi:serine/threonine-protein phosphatase 6 regulatory subunit 1
MTWGSLAPPLGNTRLHVVKLLASALSANAAALTQELLVLDVPNTLLVQGMGSGVRETEMCAEHF